MLDVHGLHEGRNLEGPDEYEGRILGKVLPFSMVRGANDSGHLVLQYEKTRKENSPMLVDSTSWVVNQGPSYLTGDIDIVVSANGSLGRKHCGLRTGWR